MILLGRIVDQCTRAILHVFVCESPDPKRKIAEARDYLCALASKHPGAVELVTVSAGHDTPIPFSYREPCAGEDAAPDYASLAHLDFQIDDCLCLVPPLELLRTGALPILRTAHARFYSIPARDLWCYAHIFARLEAVAPPPILHEPSSQKPCSASVMLADAIVRANTLCVTHCIAAVEDGNTEALRTLRVILDAGIDRLYVPREFVEDVPEVGVPITELDF